MLLLETNFNAIAQVVSLGALVPFFGVLVALEIVFNRPVVADVALTWGVGAEFNYDESTGIRLDYSTSSYAGSTDGTVMSLTVVFRE